MPLIYVDPEDLGPEVNGGMRREFRVLRTWANQWMDEAQCFLIERIKMCGPTDADAEIRRDRRDCTHFLSRRGGLGRGVGGGGGAFLSDGAIIKNISVKEFLCYIRCNAKPLPRKEEEILRR